MPLAVKQRHIQASSELLLSHRFVRQQNMMHTYEWRMMGSSAKLQMTKLRALDSVCQQQQQQQQQQSMPTASDCAAQETAREAQLATAATATAKRAYQQQFCSIGPSTRQEQLCCDVWDACNGLWSSCDKGLCA